MDVDDGNVAQFRAWNENEGVYWTEHASRFDRAIAALHARLLDAAVIAPADRVLDIGCGTGQTTRDAARAATSGAALGVDLSLPMLDLARETARTEGLANAAFEQGDAQVHPFRAGAFDLAISRTGAMFFADPVAAFSNVRRALRPGGRMTLLTWQGLAENEWFVEFRSAMADGRDFPTPPPDAPSPFSLSDPDRVHRILDEAGFSGVDLETAREQMWFGDDADEAFEFVFGVVGWMLDGLDEAGRGRALDALRASIEAHHDGTGVHYDSAAWIIHAHRGVARQPVR